MSMFWRRHEPLKVTFNILFFFRVFSGKVFLGATNRTAADQIMSIDKIFIHPKWEYAIARNDIALVKLSRNAKLNSNFWKCFFLSKLNNYLNICEIDLVQLAKLPKISNSYPRYIGAEVIASGWGTTNDGEKV